MINENNRLYDNAYNTITKIVSSSWWPWTSKKKAWQKSVGALAVYRDNIDIAEQRGIREDLRKGKLHKYKVTTGYENFPWYFEIRREGDWFLFCDGSKVMTVRHKDEKLDHTIHYRDRFVEADDYYEAIKKVEYNSKYHICSFEVEEVEKDDR